MNPPRHLCNMRLTEADLKFVVETVATKRRDHDHIIGLVRDKDDLLEPMLEDPKLAERLIQRPGNSRPRFALPDVQRVVAPRSARP